MDTVEKYRSIIKQIILDYVALCNAPTGLPTETEDHVLFDDSRNHYMVFATGWWQKERVNSVNLYVRLHNNKIYIEEDWTEEGIATDLLRLGVPREDIVLAFHPPQMRQYTEFAVA